MKLGIGSYTYTWAVGVPGHLPANPLTASALLSKAAGLGVRVVQIADNLPLHCMSARGLSALARRAHALGVSIEVGTRGIAPENLLTYLRIARQFESPILRVVVDTTEHHPSEEEIVSTLRGIAGEFERAYVCLAIENHDRFKAAALARIVRRVRSRAVGICLDTANSLGALEGPEAVTRILLPMAMNLHLKDFIVRRVSHQMGFAVEGRPAGQGQLDIPWLLERARNRRRDLNAILELWTPPEGDLQRTIAKEAEWATQSIAYLRRFIPS